MVRTRKAIYVGNQEVQRRYIGNKLIFELLDPMDDRDNVSGVEIFTEKADTSVVHVAIDGKSYQDGLPTPEYPIEIYSVNDFDVVSSVGRNYLLNPESIKVSGSGVRTSITSGAVRMELPDGLSDSTRELLFYGDYFLEYNQEYTLSLTMKTDSIIEGEISIQSWVDRNWFPESELTKIGEDEYLITQTFVNTKKPTGLYNNFRLFDVEGILGSFRLSGSFVEFFNIKVEKGSKVTDWIPYPEDITESDNHPLIDKINLSLSEPLSSVGNIKDRLFRDSDGLWKVERNVYQIILDGSIEFSYYNESRYRPAGHLAFRLNTPTIMPVRIWDSFRIDMNSHFDISRGLPDLNRDLVAGANAYSRDTDPGTDLYLVVPTNIADNEVEMQNWVRQKYDSGNPITHLFPLATPTIETLDQELQDKLNNLRSFEDSNYVYTISDTDISPTLHAAFKSQGWYDDYQGTL